MAATKYNREEIEKYIENFTVKLLSTKNITARYIGILALASLFVDAYDFASFGYAIASLKATWPYITLPEIGLVVGVI
ncbi:MAG: hypothetical protein RXR10_08040 [Vulcanisaeta sp.]